MFYLKNSKPYVILSNKRIMSYSKQEKSSKKILLISTANTDSCCDRMYSLCQNNQKPAFFGGKEE